MSFIGYLKESVNIYQNIYEILSKSLALKSEANMQTLVKNYTNFTNMRDRYSDAIDANMFSQSKIIQYRLYS